MATTEATALPWPCEAAAAGCAALTSGERTGPTRCDNQVLWTALVSYPGNGALWLAFFCDTHARAVPTAQPLSAENAAVLTDRKQQRERALAGLRYRRPTPEITWRVQPK